MMLDLPELFAPARMVKGLSSNVCLSQIDLNPLTAILASACIFTRFSILVDMILVLAAGKR